YADNLTVSIGSLLDWLTLKQTFKLYKAAFNAKINRTKTKLVPLTDIAQSGAPR
ncbi:12982_t:CDS:1, partial [Dentiscutata erythropus]